MGQNGRNTFGLLWKSFAVDLKLIFWGQLAVWFECVTLLWIWALSVCGCSLRDSVRLLRNIKKKAFNMTVMDEVVGKKR